MIKVSRRRVIFPAFLQRASLASKHFPPLPSLIKLKVTLSINLYHELMFSPVLSKVTCGHFLFHRFFIMSLRDSSPRSCFPRRSEVKARQDVKPDFRHPPFTDYRQPPVDYRHPPVTDYRQPPTLDYRQPPGLLDFRQHPAAAQFPLGIPADFRPQVSAGTSWNSLTTSIYMYECRQLCGMWRGWYTFNCSWCVAIFHPFFCRTLITSLSNWRKAQRVLASASAVAESTRWTYLCCASLRMVLRYVMEG